MPNRWESSGRPLFVKTVYVNGNRHAILSHEDPLLRSQVSFFKKTSRPNSSLSFGSDMYVTCSESRETRSVERSSKGRHHRGWKDLSSELQDCLVKLRLASSNDENMIVSDPAEVRKGTGSSTTKRQKWGRGRKKKTQNARERFKENEPEDRINKDGYRYVYNFENNKGKKNYCFVKISSEPPGVIFNSICDSSEDFPKPDSNKMVVSAAFHDLILSPYRTEKVLANKYDHFSHFEDPAELYWKNYLTKSYYNSLPERVIQWLDLTRKRKRTQNSDLNSEYVCESIASGRTFLYKNGRHKEKVQPRESVEEDVEGEVKGEPNVETALSVGNVERDSEDEGSRRNANQNVARYTEGGYEGSLTMRTTNEWEGRINQEKEVDVDSHSVTVTCRCENSARDYANGFEIVKEDFPERNQKPINKENVTRTRPVSVRELSSQQQEKNSPDHIIWGSEKDIGRPQLHIFIPMVPSKDPSEESLSECEPQITER